MDAVSDPDTHTIVIMSSAQIGKTEALNNVVGYYIENDPSPILILNPTLDMSNTWSKDRFSPMIRDTPSLRGKIADAKARDSGNTILHKSFKGGHITMAGANSPASLASRPIRILLCDEVDRYPASAGAEGDPLKLADKRTQTFWNAKKIRTSTPTIKGASRIEDEFERSDQRHFHVTCEDCLTAQVLKWAQVVWNTDDPAGAHYACEHCGVLWDDVTRWRVVQTGEWVASKPFTGIAGFHIWAAYSPWVKLGDLAVEFLDAKSKPEELKTFANTVLGETWEEKGETVDDSSLLSRREPYDAETVPGNVVLITAGVDVQDDRLEVSAWGWAPGQEAYLIDHEVLPGDPASDDLWEELDDYLTDVFVRDDGRVLRIEATAVDSGGHFTEQVYSFCAARKRRRVWAIKGKGGAGVPVWPSRPSRSKKRRIDLFMVGVDAAKELIYARINRVTEPGPGYFHFPATVDAEFFRQLTAEQVVTKRVKGRTVREWRQKRERNEALDCGVYAYAAMIGRRVDLDARAKRWKDNPDGKKRRKAKPKAGRRGGFVARGTTSRR